MNAGSELTVDARGLWCPMPILALAKALKTLRPGDLVRVIATDPAFEPDVQAFCASTGHTLVALAPEADTWVARVRKEGAPG